MVPRDLSQPQSTRCQQPDETQWCGQSFAETGKRQLSFLLPIPPTNEQRRIVAKVAEVMALCDQLDAQVTTVETDSRRLLEAVLHIALPGLASRRRPNVT